MTVQGMKLAVLDLEITDAEVEKLFLNIKITNEEDIREAVEILFRYRPHIAITLSASIEKKRQGL